MAQYARTITLRLQIGTNRRAADTLLELLQDPMFRQRVAGQMAFVLQRAVADNVGGGAAQWRYDIELLADAEQHKAD